MSIFYKKLINFKKNDLRIDGKSAILNPRRIPVDPNKKAAGVGEEYFRNWGGEDGNNVAPTMSSRSAVKTKAPLAAEVKNIVNEMNDRAEANVFNIPQRRNDTEVVDENERIDLNDTNLAPNQRFDIAFAMPGEARGVGPEDRKYYEFAKLGKTIEVEFKDSPELKEKLQVFYKIDDISDEDMRLKRTLSFTFSLKEHLSNESKTLGDLLDSIRVFNSNNINNGISSHYNQNTGELEVTFSSKRGIEEEFSKLTDINSKESKSFLEELLNGKKDKDGHEISTGFLENSGVKNILEDYDNEISDKILGKKNDQDERIGGAVQDYINEEEAKNLIDKIINSIMSQRGEKRTREELVNYVEKAIRNNFTNEVGLRKEIFKLQTLRHELLKSTTGLDGILEQIFKLNIAGNIMNQFKAISDVLSKSGLKVNPRELFGGITGGMSKEDKRSINPMTSYAHLKLEEMDRANKREFDSQKRNWERDNQGERYPDEFKSMLQKLKESVIDQIDKQISDKAQELQVVKNQQNNIGIMESHLTSELKLNVRPNIARRP